VEAIPPEMNNVKNSIRDTLWDQIHRVQARGEGRGIPSDIWEYRPIRDRGWYRIWRMYTRDEDSKVSAIF